MAAPGSRGRCSSALLLSALLCSALLCLKRSSRRNKWRLSSAQQLISERAGQQEPLRGEPTGIRTPRHPGPAPNRAWTRRTRGNRLRGRRTEPRCRATTPPPPPHPSPSPRWPGLGGVCVPPGLRSFALRATGAGRMFAPPRCWRASVAAMGFAPPQPSSASA